MTPEELLEKGIKYGDLDMIREAKRLMAGVEAPKQQNPEPAPLTNPVDEGILTKQSADVTDQFRMNIRGDNPTRRTQVDENGVIKVAAKVEQVSVGQNTFVDEGIEEKDHLKEAGLYNKPQARHRPLNQVEKICGSCNKVFHVPKQHARQYMCDRCTIRRTGGR